MGGFRILLKNQKDVSFVDAQIIHHFIYRILYHVLESMPPIVGNRHCDRGFFYLKSFFAKAAYDERVPSPSALTEVSRKENGGKFLLNSNHSYSLPSDKRFSNKSIHFSIASILCL